MEYSNIIKLICDYKKNNPDCPTTKMAAIFKLTKECIGNYLRKGSKYGWCDYNPTKEKVRERHKHGTASHPIYNVTSDLYFRDSIECQRYYSSIGIKIQYENIRAVCRGKRNHTGGMKFVEISHLEFNKMKSEFPDKVFGDFFLLEDKVA